ncbi:MAG: DUF222 domain-containing protein [Mycobacteriaceae bacterium]
MTTADVHGAGVLAALASVQDGLAVARGLSWTASDDDATTALAVAYRLQASSRATYLALLVEADGRDDRSVGRCAVAGLAGSQRVSEARVRADLREARIIGPGGTLPAMGRALAAGEISAEHVQTAVSTVSRIPVRVVAAHRAALDAALVSHARAFTAATCRDLGRYLLAALVPDKEERFDPDAHLRRELHLGVDDTGMGRLRGQLDPAGTATVKAVLDALSAPRPGQDGARDARTPAQRRADGLVEMARLADGRMAAGGGFGESARVVVHASADQLAEAADRVDAHHSGGAVPLALAGAAHCESTGAVSPSILARLACDAVIDRVVLSPAGRILAMTTLGRVFTAAQHRALAARDGGCAFPGCDRPPSWCDAHHILFWSRGGPTSTDNGVLLCTTHHTLIHHGRWRISSRNGVPWFIPPRTVDPHQNPLRNTVHDSICAATELGQQLRRGGRPEARAG